MFKNLFLILLLVIGTVATHASMHISESPDEDYLKLGREFPSVGYFYKANDVASICGSGTLINTGIKELEGRVVLTAAHIFEKEEDKDQFIFCLNEDHSSGQVFIQTTYAEMTNLPVLISPTPFDVALFFLNKPLKGPSADLDFNLSYENCLGRYLTTVGYGLTGHIDGTYRVYDKQRRASWSFASPLLNDCNLNPDNKSIEDHCKSTLGIDIKLPTYPKSEIYMGPDEGYDNSHSPVGVSSFGDSGGGIFTTDRKLVALVSSGEIPPNGTTYLISNSFYQNCPVEFDKHIQIWKEQKAKQLKEGGVLKFGFPIHFDIMPNDDVDCHLLPRVLAGRGQRIGHQAFINYHQAWLQEKFAEFIL